MADETKEIIHQHYANATAAIAAMNDQNWAYEEAAQRIIVMDGATPVYFETAAQLIIGGSFIVNQTASPQSGGFSISGNGLIGGTLTLTGVQTNSAEIAAGATLAMRRTVNTSYIAVSGGNALTAGANLLMNGGAHATAANDWSFRSGSTDRVAWDDSATLLTITGSATVGGTLGVNGQSTLVGATINGGASGQGNIYTTATIGLALQAKTGSSYDLSLTAVGGAGSYVLRVPTGTSTAEIPNALNLSYLSSGRVPVVSTAGLITQDNLYWDATNDRLGVGSGASAPTSTIDAVVSAAGTAVVVAARNTDNANSLSDATLFVQTGGASGGDACVHFNVSSAINWVLGIDNSDSDSFVLSEASTLGTSNRLKVASGGAVTIPGTLGVTGTSTLAALSATTATLSSTLGVAGQASFTETGLDVTGSNANRGVAWFGVSSGAQIQIDSNDIQAMSNTTPATLWLNGFGGLVRVGSGGFQSTDGASTFGAITATTGSFSSTLGVAGVQTNSNYLVFDANVTPVAGSIGKTSVGGLRLRAVTGSSYDFCIYSAAGFEVLTVTTGTVNLVAHSQLTTSGLSNQNGGTVFGGKTTATAGGTNWTNETAINVSGKNYAEITPTADSQTYSLTTATSDQVVFIANAHATYNIYIDMSDGSGTYQQYIQAGRGCLFRYNGTRWYSTY